MNSDRKQANLNDRIIAMHTNKIAATKVLIESAQFFINHAKDENPLKEDCMEDLVHLRKELAIAARALYIAQKEIVDCEMKKVQKEQETPPCDLPRYRTGLT